MGIGCYGVSSFGLIKISILGVMKKIDQVVLLLILAAMGMISCSDDHSGGGNSFAPVLGEGAFEGMLYIQASGKKTSLGSNDESAKVIERPKMNVEFSYDFYMDRHEVVCRQFNDVMYKVSGLQVACPQDSLPAANVTFYDAVLYANALSNENNLDSSYQYTSAEFDLEKHCIKMNGFKFNPQANGFRLPTEAEWIFVASKNWNPEQSWNASNSKNVVHKVCSLGESKNEFCDLAGNMLEVVNDRHASFKDTVVQDFVGSVDGDAIGSCVVKGGSYLSSPTSMFLFSRGDTYPILSTTKGDYIGFRLASGSISDATWFTDNGRFVSTSITSLRDALDVRQQTDSYHAKLAFRNDVSGNLVYVDYAKNTKVVEIVDTIDVYHPDISPDGKRVAFCTSIEGAMKESSVYVRDLNESGSNLVKLSVKNAAIPRWRVNPNGDTVIVYVSSAANNKSESFLKESTWQVKFSNGKFGTPQKLFDGAYHGGVEKDNSIGISSSTLLRAHLTNSSKDTDVIWYKGEQACNASLSKDGTKRTLFLDFGGSLGRDFVGEKYGVHERILVADSTGRLTNSVKSPAKYTFDHTEWAVGMLDDGPSNLILTSLTDYNGAHRQIALVNLNNGDVFPLVEGDELWHPCLWVWQKGENNPKPIVDLDSAGSYYDSKAESLFPFANVELGMKLQSFWQKNDEIEVATFGSSMLLDAVIEDSIKSFKTINMGVSLTDVHLFDYLIRHYIIPYAPKIKCLVIEVSPGLLFRNYQDMTAFVISGSPGVRYDENHLSESTKHEIAALSQEQQFPLVLLEQLYIDGTFLLPVGEWGEPFVSVDISSMSYETSSLQGSLKVIKSLKAFTDSIGVKLVAAIPPRNPKYKDMDAFDPFGPSWDVAHQIIDAVKNMGIKIFDEYKDGHHDYTDEMANNPYHLSYLGAAQFSKRLDAWLKSLK